MCDQKISIFNAQLSINEHKIATNELIRIFLKIMYHKDLKKRGDLRNSLVLL